MGTKTSKNVTPADVIDHVRRKVLTSKKRWIRLSLAKSSEGFHVDPKNADACKFCISGAVQRAVFDKLGPIPISTYVSFTATEYEKQAYANMLKDRETRAKLVRATERKLSSIAKKCFPRHRRSKKSIVYFNDFIAKSFDDIQKVLDRAAK